MQKGWQAAAPGVLRLRFPLVSVPENTQLRHSAVSQLHPCIWKQRRLGRGVCVFGGGGGIRQPRCNQEARRLPGLSFLLWDVQTGIRIMCNTGFLRGILAPMPEGKVHVLT